jgi:hypothetical protein
MRTTVTLEPDVQKLLKDAAHRSGRPFKQVLNDAVRAGLLRPRSKAPPFEQPVFSLGRAKVDLTKAGALAADLEDRDTAAAGKRARK